MNSLDIEETYQEDMACHHRKFHLDSSDQMDMGLSHWDQCIDMSDQQDMASIHLKTYIFQVKSDWP